MDRWPASSPSKQQTTQRPVCSYTAPSTRAMPSEVRALIDGRGALQHANMMYFSTSRMVARARAWSARPLSARAPAAFALPGASSAAAATPSPPTPPPPPPLLLFAVMSCFSFWYSGILLIASLSASHVLRTQSSMSARSSSCATQPPSLQHLTLSCRNVSSRCFASWNRTCAATGCTSKTSRTELKRLKTTWISSTPTSEGQMLNSVSSFTLSSM